jgi:HEAT repeat protein
MGVGRDALSRKRREGRRRGAALCEIPIAGKLMRFRSWGSESRWHGMIDRMRRAIFVAGAVVGLAWYALSARAADEAGGGAGDVAHAPAAPFRFSAAAVDLARRTAAAELAKREDPRSRRPAGLGDVDSPEGTQLAVDKAFADLGDNPFAESAWARLRYLGPAALDVLAKGLKAPYAMTRKRCAELLQVRGSPAVNKLARALRSDPIPEVRAAAAVSLGKTYDPEAVPFLMAGLSDSEKVVQTSIVRSLCEIRDGRAIEPLRRRVDPLETIVFVTAFNDSDNADGPIEPLVPPELLQILQLARDAETLAGESYGRAEIDRLAAHIGSKSSPVSDACLQAVGSLDMRLAASQALRAKRSREMLQFLSASAAPDAVEHLIDDLQSDDQDVRKETLENLGGAGRWAAPLLVELLDDPSLVLEPVEQRINGKRRALPTQHLAKNALILFLANAGHEPNVVDASTQRLADRYDDEIRLAHEWWRQYGSDFLEGKKVPNPQLTLVTGVPVK